jgi:murein DD-endopeptidase MepM/ murein hydrolase activator NlpD
MQIELTTCPACGGAYDPLRARAVRVVDGKVRAFCSVECRDAGLSAELEAAVACAPEIGRPRRGVLSRTVLPALVLVTVALGVRGRMRERGVPLPSASLANGTAHAMKPLRTPSHDEAMAMLAPRPTPPGAAPESDTWIHPLYGPARKLPVRNTRRFGAAREGMRPEECREGHCGVDLGTQRGEPVLAVHDGVVERVVREDDGKEGRFIRINHRGGTVVTSYMHLDQVRPDLKPGIPVKAGDVVGTIGETGVQHSGPHLHFAVSVRSDGDGPELFIDPEPLLHLWPVRSPPPKKISRTAQAAAERPKGI